MAVIDFTVGNYGRPRAGLPTTRILNAYVEQTKGGPAGGARIPRPGLTAWNTLGAGPILRQFQQPGLFNGDLFTISGGQLYRNTTLIGSVAYGLQPRMVAANQQLAIVTGGSYYVYDGTALHTILYFDDGASRLPAFSGVAVLYNIFILPVAGTDQFFFTSVGNAMVVNAANFGYAQTSPDPIIEVTVLAEELMFMGSTSVEFWDFNGALNAPFALAQGRTYIRGIGGQGSAVKLDNAMFWVGDDLSVYRSSSVPQKISTPFIDDRLRAAGAGVAQMTAFYIGIEGHVFYVMNLPTINESYAYDCQTQEWAQWGTQQPFQNEPGLFAGGCSAGYASGSIYVGSATTNQVWIADAANNMDGAIDKRVIVSGTIWQTGGVQRCNNIALACVRGVGDAAAPNPIVEMRYSDDGGRTWTPWLLGALGMTGQYVYKAVWRGLGLIVQPGRLIEFSVSDPVNFTVEYATYNEARV